jgi:hypothetical protein
MREHEEKLNIVDENDKVIGEDTRNNIHKKGLLHREIHVWVFDSNGGVKSSFKKGVPTKIHSQIYLTPLREDMLTWATTTKLAL